MNRSEHRTNPAHSRFGFGRSRVIHNVRHGVCLWAFIEAERVNSPESVPLGSVARQVLAYLSEHRAAQDTLEGITEWWLLEQRIRSALTEVKQALADLVARKLVIASRGRDGQMHYRMNASRERSAQSHLQNKTGRQVAGDRSARRR